MTRIVSLVGCLSLLLVVGCGQDASTPTPAPNVDGGKYTLREEPKGASGVIKARQEAKDKEEVVVVGRIGGRINPWVKGLAAFTIVDPSLKHCHELADDNCETPWDFC